MNKEFNKRKILEMLDDKSFYQQYKCNHEKGLKK